MTFYRIRDWAKHFENNRTKEIVRMTWVPVPNKHDGEGYQRIMREPDGIVIYGCWHLILQVASKCLRQRGTLLRDDGTPMTAECISLKTGWRKVADIQRALDFLSSPQVAWLEALMTQGAAAPQEGAAAPQVARAGENGTVLNGTVLNGTEQKGMQGEGIAPAAGPPPLPPSSAKPPVPPSTVKVKKAERQAEHDRSLATLLAGIPAEVAKVEGLEQAVKDWAARRVEKHGLTGGRLTEIAVRNHLLGIAGRSASQLLCAYRKAAEGGWLALVFDPKDSPAGTGHEPPKFSERYEQLFGSKIGRTP